MSHPPPPPQWAQSKLSPYTLGNHVLSGYKLLFSCNAAFFFLNGSHWAWKESYTSEKAKNGYLIQQVATAIYCPTEGRDPIYRVPSGYRVRGVGWGRAVYTSKQQSSAHPATLSHSAHCTSVV